MSKKIIFVENIPDVYQDLSSITNLIIMYHNDDRVLLKSSFMYLDGFLQKNIKVQVARSFKNILAYRKLKKNENIDHLELMCEDYILFKSNLLRRDCFGDVSELTKSIKNVVKTISCIPDAIARSLYIDKCAIIFNVETQILINESNKIVGEELKERVAFRMYELLDSQYTIDDEETQKETLSGDEFQERDLARILVLFAEEIFDKEDQITVSQYLLGNLEDIIDDFDNALYKKIVHLCMERMANGESLERSFFVNHSDQDIQMFTIDMISCPYEYSENWDKKWDLFLHSQEMPDHNFIQDSLSSLKRFRLRKLKKMLERNQLKIKELSEGNDFEQVMIYMKLNQKIKSNHDDLAREIKSAVL